MKVALKSFLRKHIRRVIFRLIPELQKISQPGAFALFDNLFNNHVVNSNVSKLAKINQGSSVSDSVIGDYSYLAQGAKISHTSIGKFCSIGPNLLSGWGIHPIGGISTSPMFYSTKGQNGITLSSVDKVQERMPIKIGNDVFIGMNVTILDGVEIGDGAVIGAGAVVSKDIPPYAVAYGNPIKVHRYRFREDQIEAMLRIAWWQSDSKILNDIEMSLFEVDEFIQRFDPRSCCDVTGSSQWDRIKEQSDIKI